MNDQIQKHLSDCTLCPRACHANRTKGAGVCLATDKLCVARAALHFWEEPVISGTKGSGAIFFSGCQLKCLFCQNKSISSTRNGIEITVEQLARIMLHLQSQGAENINLVSPTPYIYHIIEALDLIKGRLHIPVVFNSGGYECPESLLLLADYVDIFLPDFKYWEEEPAVNYSKAPNYRETAIRAILTMKELVGAPVYEDGLLKKGVIVRHLVLPGHRDDSEKIIQWIGEHGDGELLLSLMSQYTPPSDQILPYKNLNRKITSFEYNKVLQKAIELDLDGFMQERSSAKESFTPSFLGEGVLDFED